MSFQATEWARALPLRSQSQKFTLLILGSYADTEGTCFPSLKRVAFDTAQSERTTQRRIRELESLGLLVQFSRWISADGSVILIQASDSQQQAPAGCRQSSNEIRLQLAVTADQVAAIMESLGVEENSTSAPEDAEPPEEGEEGVTVTPSPGDTALSSPGRQGSVTPPGDTALPPLETSLSKPSGEATPLPPANAGGVIVGDLEQRKIGLSRLRIIEPIWPEPVTHAERATMLLGALSEAEWADCLTGARGYAAFIEKRRRAGKERVVKDLHNWVRAQQWIGYLTAGKVVVAGNERVTVRCDSPEGQAWLAIHAFSKATKPFEHNGTLLLPGTLSPQVMVFAELPPAHDWVFVAATEENRGQIAAWNGFFRKVLPDAARAQLVDDRNWRGNERIKEPGFVVPWPWPPRVDGTISQGMEAA